jgi:surface antigen
MKRRIGFGIASVALCLSGLVFAQAGAATKTVSASGGSMTFSATVTDANTCRWSSSPKIAGFTAAVQCTTGNVARMAKFKANTVTRTKSYAITLTVRGRTTTVDHWNVIQSGKTAATTTTVPPTTTTTVPPPPPPTTTTSTTASGSSMYAGQTLVSGESLSTAQYQLIMQSDGNLVEYMEGTALWSSGTDGDVGDYLILQDDGNLVIYSSSGSALWNAGTEGNAGDYLALQDDSNLVIYSSNGSPLWADYAVSSKLLDGQTLTANEFLNAAQYQLIMQSDGNLVEYMEGTAQWSSGTDGDVGDYLILQDDGNLVIYSSSGSALWNAGTEGNAGDGFVVQTDGNVVIYSSGGVALWAKGVLLNSAPGNAGSSSVASTDHATPWSNEAGVTVLCSPTPSYSCTDGGYASWLSSPSGWAWSNYGGSWPSYDSYGPHNCTLYAAYRLQSSGVGSPGWSANADDWASDAASHGLLVNQTPSVGAIAQWNSPSTGGHVAYVEQVTSSYIIVTADNYESSSATYMPGGWTDSYKISLGSPAIPDNFIHF